MYSMLAQHSLLTVLTATVVIVVARGEGEDNMRWQLYGVELPPPVEPSSLTDKLNANLSPLVLYAPASYPITSQQVASVAYDAERQLHHRHSQPAAIAVAEPLTGRQKRMGYDPQHRFLKRQFGRDSTSLRFGKRATAPTKSA